MQDEDTMLLNEPIIKPHKPPVNLEATAPLQDENWVRELSKLPGRMRNVAFMGQLHSGKTALLDLLLKQPHGT